ncbi:hypothetical protein Mapa_005112 [Marchantia paleacea]|nr:hypothetical protein Mapa_005112 [Marchantia paleacea]
MSAGKGPESVFLEKSTVMIEPRFARKDEVIGPDMRLLCRSKKFTDPWKLCVGSRPSSLLLERFSSCNAGRPSTDASTGPVILFPEMSNLKISGSSDSHGGRGPVIWLPSSRSSKTLGPGLRF